MKKIFKLTVVAILAAFLVAPIAVQAKRVDPERAEKLAQRFVESKHGPGPQARTDVRLRHAGVRQRQMQRPGGGTGGSAQHSPMPVQHDTLYYVFNINETTGGGFVIIAADDVAMPVLGFSTNGIYDENNLPPNFAYWMDYLARQIAFAKEQDIEQSATIEEAWAGELFAPMEIVGEILPTKWGQGAPYNNLTPRMYTPYSITPTGCMATAMAQIMKKYNHPIVGTGSVNVDETYFLFGSYINFYSRPLVDPTTENEVKFNIQYDWANMKNRYDNTTDSNDSTNAVATLMRHTGASVKTHYTTNGSYAYSDMAAHALINYFGYNINIRHIHRTFYTCETGWHREIRKQLNNNMPVIYRGEEIGMGNGHAFICDAYDKNSNYFHFNWGWDGIHDGWYLTSALDPESTIGVFNDFQEMTINIRPSLESDEYDIRPMLFAPFRSVSKSEVYVGETFNISIENVYNFSNDVVLFGAIGVAIVDDNDEIIEVIGQYPYGQAHYISIRVPSWSSYSEISAAELFHYNPMVCGVSANVNPGSYWLRSVYKPDSVWKIFLGSHPLNFRVLEHIEITSKFTDPIFRAEVYKLIGKSNGAPIYCRDVANITTLNIQNMGITSLNGIEYFTALERLDCSNNQLRSLDVSRNAKLQWLNCSDNNLWSLNVSNTTMAINGLDTGVEWWGDPNGPRTALRELYCRNNNLKMLNVAMTSIEVLECQNNFMADESWLTGFPEDGNLSFWPQKTDITNDFIDDNFRAVVYELIGKTPGEPILVNDVIFRGGVLDVRGKNIKSLAGIEHFTGLEVLACSNNELTELDLSNNLGLWTLDCSNNKLMSLRFSKHSSYRWFTFMDCSNNELTELDVSNVRLIELNCSNNKLTTLLPSYRLEILDCSNNLLTSLDVSNSDLLAHLYCQNNRLTELNISGTSLSILDCSNNNLGSLFIDGLSERELYILRCHNNYMANESAVINFHGEWNDDDLNFWPQKTPPEVVFDTVTETSGSSALLVTFVDESGEVIGRQLVQNGRSALPPRLTREGYTLDWDEDYSSVTESMTLTTQWIKTTAIKVYDRDTTTPNVTVVVTPPIILQGEFTAGPNPVARSAGEVGFFRQGKWISDCKLRIYDAFGNFINKLEIRDTTRDDQSRRQVGSWDLKDAKGRIVPEGTYLVRGVIKTADGKRERVSVILGVK